MGSMPRVSGFPGLRLRRPIRHSSQASGCRPGSPPSSCPPPFTSSEQLPVFSMADANAMMAVACCWRPRPRFAAAQSASRVRQVSLACRDQAEHGSGPSSGLAATIAGLPGWHQRQGMPGSRFPGGLDTLQVIHHVISQPSHYLLRACLPRIGPFRSMLLTP